MSDEFGVDIDKILEVIDAAEVLVVRFHIIEKRLLIDFRTRPGVKPLIRLVPKAESVEGWPAERGKKHIEVPHRPGVSSQRGGYRGWADRGQGR